MNTKSPLLLGILLSLCAGEAAANAPRPTAGAELRAWHKGDGVQYRLSRRPVYDHAGISAWRIIAGGASQRTAMLVQQLPGGAAKVIGMAGTTDVVPGHTGELGMIDGKQQAHVVYAGGVFQPEMSMIVTAPRQATVTVHANALIVGQQVSARKQSVLVSPLSDASGKPTLSVAPQRGAAKTFVIGAALWAGPNLFNQGQ